MIEATLYSVISSATAITALSGDRIYPVVLPTDPALPALSYMFIAGVVKPTMDTRGTQRSRVQIDCWGNTYSDAVSLREAVIQTLAGYNDGFCCQILNTLDDFEHELLQYRAVVEVYLTYSL